MPPSDHVLETDPFFSFHHINAYEVEGTPQIVVDTAAMDGGIDFSLSMENGSEAIYQRLAGRAVLTRLVLDLATGKVCLISYLHDFFCSLRLVFLIHVRGHVRCSSAFMTACIVHLLGYSIT